MVEFDRIREDGRLEKMCSHGIGHTVGHVDPQQVKGEYFFVHGCDGCCVLYEVQPKIDENYELFLISTNVLSPN